MLASAADSIALQNYRDALLNIRMIREAIERLGLPGALPSEEAVVKLLWPEAIHEAQALSTRSQTSLRAAQSVSWDAPLIRVLSP